MNKKEKQKLLNSLSLDGFTVKGDLAYGFVDSSYGGFTCLKGYLVESSSFDKNAIYFHVFIQPLYIPFTAISLNLGKRSSIIERNFLNELNGLVLKWNKYISQFETLDDFYEYLILESKVRSEDLYIKKSLAYTSIILDKDDEIIKNYLSQIINLKHDENFEWYIKDIENAEMLYNLIKNKQYDKCLEKLKQWQKDTISNIKIVM